MALKKVINALTDVSEAFRGEYVPTGDGKFSLAVEGEEDVGALKRAHERVKDELKEAKSSRDKLQGERDQAERDKLLATGDVAAIKADYEKRLADADKAAKDQLKAVEKAAVEARKSEIAGKLAGEISTVPTLMKDHISKRIRINMTDGVAIPIVLDAEGKASAMSLEDLKKEFVANKEFASIIKASNASGGGANSGGGSGPVGGLGGIDGAKKISEMTDVERRELYNRDPAAFKLKRDAENSAALANTM